MRKRKMNTFHAWVLGIITIQSISKFANGQVGVSICACQPGIYTFQLNFTAQCVDSTVRDNPGVVGADCFQRGVGVNAVAINDTVPIQINTIQILELDADQAALAQTPYDNTYNNGDTFVYTSPLLASKQDIDALTPDTVPRGLQMNLQGINKEEQPITNVWIILFNNNCSFYPVLNIGDNIGWTTLIDIQQPYESVCPIAATPSPAPFKSTTTPSYSPSTNPSEPPSQYPSDHPSESPLVITEPPVPNSYKTSQPSVICIPRPDDGHYSGKGKGEKGSISGGKENLKSKSKHGKGSGTKSGLNGKGGKGSKSEAYDYGPSDSSLTQDGRRVHKPDLPYCDSLKYEKKSKDLPSKSHSSEKLVKSSKDKQNEKIEKDHESESTKASKYGSKKAKFDEVEKGESSTGSKNSGIGSKKTDRKTKKIFEDSRKGAKIHKISRPQTSKKTVDEERLSVNKKADANGQEVNTTTKTAVLPGSIGKAHDTKSRDPKIDKDSKDGTALKKEKLAKTQDSRKKVHKDVPTKRSIKGSKSVSIPTMSPNTDAKMNSTKGTYVKQNDATAQLAATTGVERGNVRDETIVQNSHTRRNLNDGIDGGYKNRQAETSSVAIRGYNKNLQ